MILAALAMFAADPSALAGFYRSTTMEVGAAIELEADGHFFYALDYGAVSEAAEGQWSLEGDTVFLTATKMEGQWKAPKFDHTPLRLDGNVLLLDRYDRQVRFEREGEPAIPDVPNKNLEKGN